MSSQPSDDPVDVEPGAGRQHHRLGEPHRILHRIRQLSLDVRQNRCGGEHSVRDDGREAEQLRGDRVGVDRVVVPADRRVVADLPRRDAQHRVRRAELRLLLRRRLRLVGQAGALLVQKRRHLMPGGVVADVDVGDDVDQQPACGARAGSPRARQPDTVSVTGDRPVLRDVVLDVHRTHCGEGEVEAGDQRHDGRERQRERIGQRHRVAEPQPGDVRVRRDVGPVDRADRRRSACGRAACRRAG